MSRCAGSRQTWSAPVRSAAAIARETVRREPRVAVDEQQPRRVGVAGADAQRVRLAEPALGQFVHSAHAQPGVAGGEGGERCERAVLAAVVDGGHAQGHALLVQQARGDGERVVAVVAHGEQRVDPRPAAVRVGRAVR